MGMPAEPGFVNPNEGGQDNNQGTNPDPPNQGGHPGWDELLGVIPAQLHTQVLPHLQKWDHGVQSRFQQVHSQYEPYKQFIDNKVDVEDLQQGYGILQALKEDPESVYRALQDAYKFGTPDPGVNGGQGEAGGAELEDTSIPPHIAQELDALRTQVQQMAQILVTKGEQDAEAEEYAKLESELAAAKKEHGEFDERFVLALMQNGATLPEAVSEYSKFVDGVRAQHNRPAVPRIISPGSAIPQSGGIDPTKLNPRETRDLMAKYLAADQAANRSG